MRALLITPTVPSATGNGLAMRAGTWLEALARRFDTDVVVTALFQPPAGADAFTRPLASRVDMLWGSLPQRPGVPRLVPEPDEPSAAILRERIADADIVVVLRLYVAGLAQEATERGIPVVIDLDDLDWVREERLGDPEEAQAYRAHADRVLGLASVVTTASADDAARGPGASTAAPWRHVPNGVREPAADGTTADDIARDIGCDIDLLFVATLGYGPNADGAEWLVREVLPLLPGTTAAIVGAAPQTRTQALAAPGVVVAGDVAEVGSWYARARACVVPIHAGAGTRTKIPEAWAHGRPVVTTTIGAEGLDVDGAALVADDPASFASACARLLDDEGLVRQLVETGTERYLAHHAFERAVDHADAAVAAALRTVGRELPPRRVRT